MDPLLARLLDDLRHFVRWIAASSSTASLVELPGVTASVVPAVPDRSVFNSVVYEDAHALHSALPELAAAYEHAGVRAWTVWTPEADSGASETLAAAGHVLDASPLAMVCELDGFQQPDPGDLDVDRQPELSELAAVNDASYPFEGTPFGDCFDRRPDGTHAYVARLDGRPACALFVLDLEESAGVYSVATVPEARGRGLAYRLLGLALADAHERGCTLSTLQSTKMGAPVYDRLGYRSLGALEMWERRKPAR